MTLVTVGTVVGTHGYDGTLRVMPASDNPTRFRRGAGVLADGIAYVVYDASRAGQSLLMRLRGISSKEEAARLVGVDLVVPADDVPPLPEGSYYHFQLIGLTAFASDGTELGVVTEILETGANDVYVIAKDDLEWLVPAIEDVVLDVDLAAGRMNVDLPEGSEPRQITQKAASSHRPRRRRRPARAPKTQANTQDTS